MYRPRHFREDDPGVLAAFVSAHPLAALVAITPRGFVANHIPMLLMRDPAGRALLLGHIARANDLWKVVDHAARVLVIFGGAQHYISPSWYPSKIENAKVVPTWNYAVAHAHGSIRFIEERETLLSLVETLTRGQESRRVKPWAVDDAPRDFIDGMLQAIIGFEIIVDRLEGKFKASQNLEEADRAGAAEGLAAEGISIADRDQIVRGPRK
jgi:transcriptional regulator